MLIRCPECDKTVSDKAFACPHCGYPINMSKPIRRSNRKRRLPNGFGQITELKSRNLKRPFRAMVTIGFNEYGRPIQKLLKPNAYFETYNQAYEALLKYNNNPYSFDSSMTVKELFDKWHPEYIKKVGPKTSGYVNSSWKRLEPIWSIRLCDLRKAHIKAVLNDADTTPVNINNMKRVIKSMLDYAVEYEIIEKNVAENINMSDAIVDKSSNYTTEHHIFTDDELKVLWDNVETNLFAKYIIIQCYMGWRPTELISLKKEDVNLEDKYVIGGMKTESGTNRKVPIHSAILPLIEELCHKNTGIPYLVYGTLKGEYRQLNYGIYLRQFVKALAKMGLDVEHTAHDPRVTFITNSKKYKMDEYAIKYIVGHKINDLTENTYTKREIGWLKSEIEKIKV